MFQLLLFVGSIVAFIIGGLIVLIGIGAITGCAGGILAMCTGAIIAVIGAWSVITFLIPSSDVRVPAPETINLVRRNGRWV